VAQVPAAASDLGGMSKSLKWATKYPAGVEKDEKRPTSAKKQNSEGTDTALSQILKSLLHICFVHILRH
jgi:hypothetical protein